MVMTCVCSVGNWADVAQRYDSVIFLRGFAGDSTVPARQFYTRIKADPTVPYAKSMQEIRKLAYAGQDPEDSYAAYCFYGAPKAAQAF
jgi:hypothetical protein